ncbi:MAG: hypothetical protein JWN88_592 [Frankiales bacterium]|nr:hypothetical protein [Frankiales bacterium]
MDKLKQLVALALVVSLGILAAGWFLLVSPKKSEADATRDQAEQQDAANRQLEVQLKQLQAQAKDLPKKQADIARVAAKIPDNPSLPSLIRAVTAASVASGVEFVSITPSAPKATAAAVPSAAVAAPARAQSTSGTAPAKATGELYGIPVDLEVVGSYLDIAQFLAALEDMPRAMRVTNVALAPGVSASDKGGADSTKATDGSSLVLTLTGEVFMATNRPAATAVVVPGQATPAAPVAASVPTAPAN